MITSQKNLFSGRQGKISKTVVAALIIILAIFVLNYFRSGIKGFFYLISNPIQKSFWRAGDNISKILGSDLKKEAADLRVENQALLNQISLLESLKKENQDLRTALDLSLQKEFNLIFSGIVSKDSAADMILIDRGSDDGILKDMPVVNPQKVVLGKILEVYKNFSRVVLITDKTYTFDAKVQGKEIYGLAKGGGGSGLYFDFISKEAELKEGDVLATAALGGEFPDNLLIGKVEKINKEDTKPFQSADIKVFFDLKETDNLFIVTNFKN